MEKRLGFILIFLLCSPLLLSLQENSRVTAEKANIYVDPDTNSSIIAIVKKGTVLTFLSREKMHGTWYFVSLYSDERQINVSGFIQASMFGQKPEVREITEKEKPEQTEKDEASELLKVLKEQRPKTVEKEEELKKEVEAEEASHEPSPKIKVILSKANVRLEPTFNSQKVCQIKYGTVLTYEEKTGEWFKVRFKDKDGKTIQGYIHLIFVEEIIE